MRTLVYIRRSKQYNETVLNYANKEIEATTLTTVSEYSNGQLHIDMNIQRWDYCSKASSFMEQELDLGKIIFRDRLLRNTPYHKALVLIRRAVGNCLEIFENQSFDALVTYPVDNYIMDILMEVAKKNDVKCYGVCNFFIAEYKRLTLYGEHNPHRVPSKEEVDKVVNRIQNNFRSHMAPDRNKAIKAGVVRYLKYKLRYPLFYLLGYKLLRRNEYDLMCTPYITTVRNFFNFFIERHFVDIQKIDFSKKTILVPLHYFPEATIEYWCDNEYQVDFEDMLKCKIDDLSKRYDQILLKEHPATVFDNSSKFYNSLKDNNKVVLIDPFVSTNKLLDHVDVLGCWTGTAGIEALVNGKKVELFVDEQYYRQAMNKHPEIISNSDGATSISDPHLFIEEILKGCVKVEN